VCVLAYRQELIGSRQCVVLCLNSVSVFIEESASLNLACFCILHGGFLNDVIVVGGGVSRSSRCCGSSLDWCNCVGILELYWDCSSSILSCWDGCSSGGSLLNYWDWLWYRCSQLLNNCVSCLDWNCRNCIISGSCDGCFYWCSCCISNAGVGRSYWCSCSISNSSVGCSNWCSCSIVNGNIGCFQWGRANNLQGWDCCCDCACFPWGGCQCVIALLLVIASK